MTHGEVENKTPSNEWAYRRKGKEKIGEKNSNIEKKEDTCVKSVKENKLEKIKKSEKDLVIHVESIMKDIVVNVILNDIEWNYENYDEKEKREAEEEIVRYMETKWHRMKLWKIWWKGKKESRGRNFQIHVWLQKINKWTLWG